MNIMQTITKLKNDKDYAAFKKCSKNEEELDKATELHSRIAKKFLKVEYLPYEKKVALCESIVNFTMMKTDQEGNKTFHINSPMRQMLLILNIFDNYVADVDFNDGAGTFNILQTDEDAQFLFGLIPQSERELFVDIIDMVEEDYRENYRSTPAYIDGKVDAFKLVLDKILETMGNNPKVAEVIANMTSENSSK